MTHEDCVGDEAAQTTKIKENIYLLDGGTKLGLIVGQDGQAVLIDSGIDEHAAQRAIRAAEELGVRIRAVINTHGHADHCGGNIYLQQMLGVDVYTRPLTAAIISEPILETMYLYGTSQSALLPNAFKTGKTKDVRLLGLGPLSLCGINFGIIPLPGHISQQVGVLVDGVLFCGDALLSPYAYEKLQILFVSNVQKTLETLAYLENCPYEVVASHIGVVQDVGAVARYNADHHREIMDLIYELLQTPRSREELVQLLIQRFNLPQTIKQFHMMIHCVSTYVAYLREQARAEYRFFDGMLRYVAI